MGKPLVASIALQIFFAFGIPDAAGQPRMARVGLLANTIPLADIASGRSDHPAPQAVRDGLRALGWVEGRNVQLVWRSAEGDLRKLPALADELVRERVDVLVAWGPGVEAVAARTRKIPIVMGASAVADRDTRIESLARPGHNITGMTLVVGPELNGKRLALLKQLAPRMRKVAFVTQTKGVTLSDVTRAAARELHLEIYSMPYDTAEDLPDLFDTMAKSGIDAAIICEEPIANLPATQVLIHRAAAKHRMPVLHMPLSAVETGGLIAYGQDIRRLYDRTAYFIDRILRGTNPGDIPIEQPARFELWVNARAARSIGLVLPSALLVQADRVIE